MVTSAIQKEYWPAENREKLYVKKEDEQIDYVKIAKYLRVTIDSNLKENFESNFFLKK